MTRKPSTFLILLAFLVSGFSYGALAQNKSKQKSEEENSYPSKQKAVHHVKRKTGGRVLDIKQRAGKIWRVKFLKDGKIQYMDVAPQLATD